MEGEAREAGAKRFEEVRRGEERQEGMPREGAKKALRTRKGRAGANCREWDRRRGCLRLVALLGGVEASEERPLRRQRRTSY